MAISSTSTGLSPGQLDLATQISALQTSLATAVGGFATSMAAKIAALQSNLVDSLMGSGRVSAANIITSLGVNTSIDTSVGGTLTNRKNAAANVGAGDNATHVNSLQIHAVHNALTNGSVTAASILSTMS